MQSLRPKKIMFAYLRTGANHLAVARALAAYVHLHHNEDAVCILHDGLRGAPPVVRMLLEGGYRFLRKRGRWLSPLFHALLSNGLIATVSLRFFAHRLRRPLRDRILAERPDAIVVLHYFLPDAVDYIVRTTSTRIPVVTMVTDLHAPHSIWFRRPNRKYVVFNTDIRRQMERIGIGASHIRVFPYPLSEQFSLPMTDELILDLRRQLELPLDRKVLVIMGGRDGYPRGEDVLRVLLPTVFSAEIILVAGRDDRLVSAARALKRRHPSAHLRIYGHVDFVAELLSVATVVLSRADASSIMEVLLTHRVPIITDAHREEEKANVTFVLDNRFGFYHPDLETLPRLVNRLLHEPALIARCLDNIGEAELTNGTPQVAAFLLGARAAQSAGSA